MHLQCEIYWLLLPGHSAALHLIRQLNVLAINVVLPLPLSENPGKYRARVNAHPHVDRAIGRLLNVLDRLHHRQPHMHAEDRVIWPFHGCTTYTVVTIAQNFDAQLLESTNRNSHGALYSLVVGLSLSEISWRISEETREIPGSYPIERKSVFCANYK